MTDEPIQNIINTRLKETPFGALKTAELDVQFSIDPSFGLTKERYGWYSNLELFNSLHFTEGNGQIEIETGANADDTAELRSSYPGRYVAHTVSEPGVGVQIPSEYLEYDTSGAGETVSLTHGEISLGLIEVDRDTQSGVNTLAFSFEPDAVYAQLRKNNQDVVKVPQKDWNIDPMDGTGPSGKVLRPEEGYIYTMPHTWYGQGALLLAVQDREDGEMIAVHSIEVDGGSTLGTPNMPLEVAVQNLGTAAPLGVNVGGMQYATHGSSTLGDSETGRTTEEFRQSTDNYVDLETVVTGNAIDPFAEPGRPIVAVQRDFNELESRVSLSVDIIDLFFNTGGNVYGFIFDEFDPDTALTGANFTEPTSRGATPSESKLLTDTEATAYTPTDAVLRGMVYVSGDKNTANTITGDSTARLPLEATAVVTAALPPGGNSTYTQPGGVSIREGW